MNNYFGEKQFSQSNALSINDFPADFEDCEFRNYDFSTLNLSACRFTDCYFEACNFSGAKMLQTALQNSSFKDCKMLGLSFETCSEFAFSPNFENCNLQHSSFYGMQFKGASFLNCNLGMVEFTAANLQAANFENSDLNAAIFSQCNLEKANFSNSLNFNIDPLNNRIKGAIFKNENLAGLLQGFGIKIKP